MEKIIYIADRPNYSFRFFRISKTYLVVVQKEDGSTFGFYTDKKTKDSFVLGQDVINNPNVPFDI